VLEILSDIRDPLDELESEEVREAQKQALQRFDEIQSRLDEIETKLRKARSTGERDQLKAVRDPALLPFIRRFEECPFPYAPCPYLGTE
jgi:chromosome segregation ATPase